MGLVSNTLTVSLLTEREREASPSVGMPILSYRWKTHSTRFEPVWVSQSFRIFWVTLIDYQYRIDLFIAVLSMHDSNSFSLTEVWNMKLAISDQKNIQL